MSKTTSVKILVYGLVQGVFFRVFTQKQAERLGLSGYVINLSGGAVEAVAEGDKDKLDRFISKLSAGPPGSEVKRLEITWNEYSGRFANFTIRY